MPSAAHRVVTPWTFKPQNASCILATIHCCHLKKKTAQHVLSFPFPLFLFSQVGTNQLMPALTANSTVAAINRPAGAQCVCEMVSGAEQLFMRFELGRAGALSGFPTAASGPPPKQHQQQGGTSRADPRRMLLKFGALLQQAPPPIHPAAAAAPRQFHTYVCWAMMIIDVIV